VIKGLQIQGRKTKDCHGAAFCIGALVLQTPVLHFPVPTSDLACSGPACSGPVFSASRAQSIRADAQDAVRAIAGFVVVPAESPRDSRLNVDADHRTRDSADPVDEQVFVYRRFAAAYRPRAGSERVQIESGIVHRCTADTTIVT